MKSFKHFGIKRRVMPDHNYNALWLGDTLKTIRFGEGHAKDLPYLCKEFYDVAINCKCNLLCNFCYTNATSNGSDYPNPGELFRKFINKFGKDTIYTLSNLPKDEVLDVLIPEKYRKKLVEEGNNIAVTYTTKPFQIAIGSTGEPTIHPEFCNFLKSVYKENIVPNYTTNGVVLSYASKIDGKEWKTRGKTEAEVHENIERAHEILEYTRKYVGGVAVSYGNPVARPFAEDAVKALLEYGDCHINIHHIIGGNSDVDELIKLAKDYGDDIKYHVLLPLMAHGRSAKGMEPETFDYLEEQILKNDIKNIAFGANFSPYLEKAKIKTWNYPPESLSANMILKGDKVEITPSSFNLSPVETIEFA